MLQTNWVRHPMYNTRNEVCNKRLIETDGDANCNCIIGSIKKQKLTEFCEWTCPP